MSRLANLHILTRRLIILTAGALLFFGGLFALTLYFESRLMISWVVFVCGIIGGFVSIQQRVKRIPDKELSLLCGSWFQILLIPIFGAVFSLVLYCIFLSGLLNSNIFPVFHFPVPPKTGANTDFIVKVLRETYPLTGPDLAKLIFWSFVAGFAERFVPQIISNLTPDDD
jgi:hypothetical protein